MNTWTIENKLHTNKYSQVSFVFDTLISPFSVSVVNYLQAHGKASLSDLVIQTSFEATQLQMHLNQMLKAGVLIQKEDELSIAYELNYPRLSKASYVAKQLAAMIE